MNARSADPSTNDNPPRRGCGCRLSTKKSMSSSSPLASAIYLRCWRTRNSCSSKYSRTMVSLTALMSGIVECSQEQLDRHCVSKFHLADFPGENKLDLAGGDFFVELHRG